MPAGEGRSTIKDMRPEHGQTMAEYSVTLTVITLALLSAFAMFSEGVRQGIEAVVALIPG